MTAQEVFDAVARHLLTQGKQSYSYERGECMYRGDGNLKCAVGALISDDEYDSEMEEKPVEDLHRKGMLPGRLAPHLGLLERLQHAHDQAGDVADPSEKAQEAAFKNDIPDLLCGVAAAFGLSTDVLKGGVR
jgi:hypothetical protein